MKALVGGILLFTLLSCSSDERHAIRINLDAQWTLDGDGLDAPITASVPGNVHIDLLRAGRIPDPEYDTNEVRVQWVEEGDWTYTSQFLLNDSVTSARNIDMVFKGLDTYARVSLNDSLILKADNMHRSWIVPVNHLLRPGTNKLEVHFASTIDEGEGLLRKYGRSLPADNDVGPVRVSPFLRKAPYHFGWDFAQRLVTSGIWKEIEVRAWNNVIIDNVHVEYDIEGSVRARALVRLQCAGEQEVQVRLWNDQRIIAHSLVRLHEGKQVVPLDFTVDEPELWWPHGAGHPHLYRYHVEVLRNGTAVDQRSLKVGYRDLELDRSVDGIGQAFQFMVNDSAIFMRGANLVPPGVMKGDGSVPDWLKLVEHAVECNMNMLRIWGGGVYPPEEFYHACDSLGILIWQDLMFANAMVPGDREFRARVESEVKEVAARYRSHPSMALWCGNNEIAVAWKNWGWQDRYVISAVDSSRMWQDYRTLFHDLIPSWIRTADRKTPYVSTSPLSNWGSQEGLDSGDLHYWGVYHGNDGISDFADNVGRFVSEYGMQSYPSSDRLKLLTDSIRFFSESDFWRSRQKSYKLDKPIVDAIRERYWQPRGPEEFIRLSQLHQSDCYETAIRAHRFSEGRCAGTLYWQLNDVWSGASWAGIESDGTWKPAQYAVKRSYKANMLRFLHKNDSIWVEVLDDKNDYSGDVHLRLFHSDGRLLWERSVGVKDARIGGWSDIEFARLASKNQRILFAEWRGTDGQELASKEFIWVPPGRFWQYPAQFQVKRTKLDHKRFKFEISTNRPVYRVLLNPSGFVPDDEAFALPPDRKKTILSMMDGPADTPKFVKPEALIREERGRTGNRVLFSGLVTTKGTE